MLSRFLAACGISFALASLPAIAHQGLIHEGCPTGQVFQAGDLTVSGAFTRATLPSAKVGGGYLEIQNSGSSPDRLLGATTEAAQSVEVHEMKMDGDMMKMAPVAGGLEVPAGGSVALTPSGYHLMFTGVRTPFKEGQCLQLTLRFEKAGELPVVLNIAGPAAKTAPTGETAPTAVPADEMPGMDHSGMEMQH